MVYTYQHKFLSALGFYKSHPHKESKQWAIQQVTKYAKEFVDACDGKTEVEPALRMAREILLTDFAVAAVTAPPVERPASVATGAKLFIQEDRPASKPADHVFGAQPGIIRFGYTTVDGLGQKNLRKIESLQVDGPRYLAVLKSGEIIDAHGIAEFAKKLRASIC